MQKPLYWIFILLMFEIVVIILVVPNDWVETMIKKETEMTMTFLGSGTGNQLDASAKEYFGRLMIDTGAYRAIHDFFVPTEQERLASKGMENLGQNHIFPYVKSRIQTFGLLVYMVIKRLLSIIIWLPYLAILAIPAIYDGYNQWHINRSSYSYSSPLMHRYGVRGIVAILVLALMFSIIPLPIPPIVVPVAGFCLIAFLGITIKHLQKRI